MNRRRNEIERLFRRIKGVRRMFSRFSKRDAMFIAFFNLALIVEATRNANKSHGPRVPRPHSLEGKGDMAASRLACRLGRPLQQQIGELACRHLGLQLGVTDTPEGGAHVVHAGLTLEG